MYTANGKEGKKKVNTTVMQWRSANFTTDRFDALNEILQLETQHDAEPFKDVFLEPHKLVHHFNISTYLLKDVDCQKLQARLEKLDDFPIKKLQSDSNKMSLLRKFEKDTAFDRPTFQCQTGLKLTRSKQYNQRFIDVFGYTRQTLDFTDSYVCTQQLYKCYRQLFGDIVTKKKVKKAKKVVVEYTLLETRLEHHKALLKHRNP